MHSFFWEKDGDWGFAQPVVGNIAAKHVEDNSEEYPVSALDANVFRSRSRAFKKSDDAN